MCAWVKKFLKNNHLIVFILINLLVSAKTKEKRKYKKDNEENIYTLSKTLPHGSLSYYYYKKNICSFFCNSWWSLFPCCNCEKNTMCHNYSMYYSVPGFATANCCLLIKKNNQKKWQKNRSSMNVVLSDQRALKASFLHDNTLQFLCQAKMMDHVPLLLLSSYS